ncbi:ChbG/HpnK family deacetylase [Candidatus Fermentibacterales bacterium]|nr:ChbG/HpnK family deacetylase [Candidatus Fermentibacterales bacterium]
MRMIHVNVDDAGLSPGVTSAIERCAAAGRMHGASILATGSHVEEAARAVAGSGVSVAAHLDCLQGPFLTGADLPGSALAWAAGAGDVELLRREWGAQIERLLGLGLEVSRLDSHRHAHHLPRLRGPFLSLAMEYRIERVRCAILPDWWMRPGGILLNSLGKRLARAARSLGMTTPDSLLGFGRSGRVDRAYLQGMTPRLRHGTVELAMHPSASADWSPGQPGELDLMMSSWFGEWLEETFVH